MTKKKQVNRRERETKRRKKDRGIMTNRKKAKVWCLPLKTTFCLTCVVWDKYSYQSHDLLAAKLIIYGLETPL